MVDTNALSIRRATGQAIAHRIDLMKTQRKRSGRWLRWVGWCAQGITTYGNVGVLTFIGIVVYIGFPLKGFEFCFAGNAKRCTKKQMPFMAGESDCPPALSRAPGCGVHRSEAQTLYSGRNRRRVWPGRADLSLTESLARKVWAQLMKKSND